jgi:hypothetical protein
MYMFGLAGCCVTHFGIGCTPLIWSFYGILSMSFPLSYRKCHPLGVAPPVNITALL